MIRSWFDLIPTAKLGAKVEQAASGKIGSSLLKLFKQRIKSLTTRNMTLLRFCIELSPGDTDNIKVCWKGNQ